MLGTGLAMDACAVSMTNGFNNPTMATRRKLFIAFVFAFFQGLMPLIGFFIGHSFLFLIGNWVGWIAFAILSLLGINMIFSATNKKEEISNQYNFSIKLIVLQAIATSIDALSAGIAFAGLIPIKALISVLIISLVTFIICFIGINIGARFGKKLGSNAEIFGGVILIIIGLEIFISNIL